MADAVLSFKVLSCSEDDSSDFLGVSIVAYMSAGCAGLGVPYVSSKDIPLGCHNSNMRASCQSEPVSLEEKWPAVDVYFNDDTCESSTISLTMKPGCVSLGGVGVGWKCHVDTDLMSWQMFDSCSAAAEPTNFLAVPQNMCLPARFEIGQSSNAVVALIRILGDVWAGVTKNKLLRGGGTSAAVDHHSKMSAYYEGYYIARCDGY